MRRNELASQDAALFAEVAQSCDVGYLALVTADGYPRSIALNFAAVDETIYFHGALEGEKYELIKSSPRAGFTMATVYSFIPSFWTAPRNACPATQFFKSVEIVGICEGVADLAEKAVALMALMVKQQPEGHYDPIDPEDPRYRKALENVGVFRVAPHSWTGKVKFGQNEPAKLRRVFVEKLKERGGLMDDETAREIEKSL